MATARTGTGRRSGIGRTSDAGSVILGAKFWKAGTIIKASFLRSFITKLDDGSSGECYQFLLDEPKTLDIHVDQFGRFDEMAEKKINVDKIAIGALTGFTMALQALQESTPWFSTFQRGDLVTINCVGIQDPTQRGYSGMPTFEVQIER